MKYGLRFQLSLRLSALILLAFAPLFWAMSTYTEVALQKGQTSSSRALGRITAAYVAEAARSRDAQELVDLLDAQISERGILAIGLYGPHGRLQRASGSPAIRTVLPAEVAPQRESSEAASNGSLLITVPWQMGSVAVLVSTGEAQSRLLNQALAVYLAVVGTALLFGAYWIITRWIIVPLGQLAAAAQQVRATTRPLRLPESGSRELAELASSFRQMTDQLFTEEEALRRKVEELQKATDELHKAQAQVVHSERLASVGQLAAGLAHEVGNPLTAMQGMQDLLLDGDVEPEVQLDFIGRMRKETERINNILRDLLHFARAGSKASDPQGEPGNVEAAITETVALVAPQVLFQDVDLGLDVYPDLPRVSLSHDQLTQVLLNLVMNGAAATNGQGAVQLRAESGALGVLLTVTDDGPGVPADLQDTLFEPFVSSKEVGEGTGLGLSVCKGLVEGAGGRISLDASFQPGARFVLELPAAKPSPES